MNPNSSRSRSALPIAVLGIVACILCLRQPLLGSLDMSPNPADQGKLAGTWEWGDSGATFTITFDVDGRWTRIATVHRGYKLEQRSAGTYTLDGSRLTIKGKRTGV